MGGVRGRISELAVRMAISRESCLLKGHQRLLGMLTKLVASESNEHSVKCQPTELLQERDAHPSDPLAMTPR